MNLPVATWRGLPVPYITPWTAERMDEPPLTVRRGRLAYIHEGPYDRHDEVLWARVPYARGAGKPNFPGVHAWRQRQAILHDLCQICAQPAALRGGRFLFLLGARDGRPIQEGETTAVPPVHPECARQAVRYCPHLHHWAAALVTGTPAWGVAGIRYAPGALVPLPGPDPEHPDGLSTVAYTDDAGLRWVLAAREVIELLDVEPVTDLDALAEAYPLPR